MDKNPGLGEGNAIDGHLYGYDLFGDAIAPEVSGPVADKFLFPPFSILDARGGDWQERKRAWLALGIESELGRETGGNYGDGVGGKASIRKGVQGHITQGTAPEIAERFEAGGSVRGITAALLTCKYWGCDLRPEQVLATPVGSACLRVTRQFNGGRKLVKLHQNVLVFVKGDWKRAAAACGRVDMLGS